MILLKAGDFKSNRVTHVRLGGSLYVVSSREILLTKQVQRFDAKFQERFDLQTPHLTQAEASLVTISLVYSFEFEFRAEK